MPVPCNKRSNMPSTKIIKIDPEKPDMEFLKEAAEILRKGGLVIIPTETVYGIAANILDKGAVHRLYEIKQRPKDKPFSLLISEKGNVNDYAVKIPVSAYKLMDKFWPGPLTLILEAKDINGRHPLTIGIRMPDNRIALEIISFLGFPIACPSANISGKPAPLDFKQAISDLNGLVDMAIDSGVTKLGIESTLVDLTVEPCNILREGVIKREEIAKALKKKTVLFVCTGNSCRSVMAEALLKKKLNEANRMDIEVLSAGVSFITGLGATEATKEILAKEGIDVTNHRSTGLTKDILRKSDIILAMERLHEERILQLAPEVKNRLFLLKEFAKIIDTHADILDPIGRPIEFYEEVFRIIKSAIERVAEVI